MCEFLQAPRPSRHMFNTPCLAFIAIALSLFLCGPVAAQIDDLPPSITVVGEGKATGKPDIAEVSIGVVTTGASGSAAVSSNNQAMASLMQALSAEGIAQADISTSGFSVFPEYRGDRPMPDSAGASRPSITGYRATNQVTVKVRNVSILGRLLDNVVKAGANNINGVRFVFSDVAPIADEARKRALADADRRAKVFAQAAGIQLGELLYIREGAPVVPLGGAMEMRAMSGAPDVPVSVGDQEVTSHITAIYAIPAKSTGQ